MHALRGLNVDHIWFSAFLKRRQMLSDLSHLLPLLLLARVGKWDELELFDLTPTVNTLLCRAMVVEKDRDHMIDLIDRKTQAVADSHGALLLALQGMARNR